MAKAPARLPIDFNYVKPDNILVTDPIGAELQAEGKPIDRDFPAHVHKFVAPGEPYEYKVVHNAKEKADALAQGWGNAHDLDKLHAKDAAKAAAPASAKPKRKRSGKPPNPKPKPVAKAKL